MKVLSVDEIAAKLTPAELEQVIKIVGRSPRGYPPGAYDALKVTDARRHRSRSLVSVLIPALNASSQR